MDGEVEELPIVYLPHGRDTGKAPNGSVEIA